MGGFSSSYSLLPLILQPDHVRIRMFEWSDSNKQMPLQQGAMVNLIMLLSTRQLMLHVS